MKSPIRRILLIVLPIVLIFISLFIGRYMLTPGQVIQVLTGAYDNMSQEFRIVMFLRLPRAVAAAFCGAALAVSGAAFQSVFRNPLVNSGLLGISNGASFGACLAIVLLGGGAATYFSSFGFAIVAVLLAYFCSKISGSSSGITLILGGVIVSAFFSALVSIFKYMADPLGQLPAITFWMLGSFADISYIQFWAFIPMTAGMLLIYMARWRINVISMGNREAISLGVNVKLYKFLVIGGATLATASAVCISGSIGWIGLIIPHIGRMLVGNDNRKLIPISISFGASFMVVMDLLSRTISGSEIPVGIFCALIGAPFFAYLLKKTRGGAW